MAKTKLVTRFLEDKEYEAWNRFVVSSPSGSTYSVSEYLDALCQATGGRFRILAVFKGDEIQGGVGLYERSSLGGTFVDYRLLLAYNGLVLREFTTRYPSERTSRLLAIMSALEKALSSAGYSYLFLQSRNVDDVRPFIHGKWRADVDYTYVKGLEDMEEAWRTVDQNQRRLIKRCREKGLEVTEDGDFDSFYDMHLRTVQRKDLPLYLPRDAYRRFVERLRLQNLVRLYHARLPDGRAVATQLVLVGDHPVTHTLCAAADPDYMNLGSNPFLRWEVFEDLARLGYAANDLTGADMDDVARFKSQLGGDLVHNIQIWRRPSPRWTACRLSQEAYWLASGGAKRVFRVVRGVWNR